MSEPEVMPQSGEEMILWPNMRQMKPFPRLVKVSRTTPGGLLIVQDKGVERRFRYSSKASATSFLGGQDEWLEQGRHWGESDILRVQNAVTKAQAIADQKASKAERRDIKASNQLQAVNWSKVPVEIKEQILALLATGVQS